jgi:hypothetical protein
VIDCDCDGDVMTQTRICPCPCHDDDFDYVIAIVNGRTRKKRRNGCDDDYWMMRLDGTKMRRKMWYGEEIWSVICAMVNCDGL